jgi:ubiquinone biosynthesis protein COQ9
MNKNALKFVKKFCSEEINSKLIKMSLLNVSKYGWTENSIKIAANELNYSHNLSALLKNGPIDLVYYTMDNWENKLKDEIDNIKNSEM